VDDQAEKPRPRTCPHCGKEIPTLPRKPRDLGLLLNVLLYRVAIDAEITEPLIEKVRQHCRMKPERLAELRKEPHARFWRLMLQRRAARLAYFREHGELPPRWMPLLPGDRDHGAAMNGLRRYRKGGLARMKSQLRKHPDKVGQKLSHRYLKAKRIRSHYRRNSVLDQVTAELLAILGAQTGKLSLREYEALQTAIICADTRSKRRRKKPGGIGLDAGNPAPKEAGLEPPAQVPAHGPQER